MSKDCLRTGDKAIIHFRFIKHPEYMTPGQRMVFREGRTKAVGNIVRIITQTTPTHPNARTKQNKQQRYGGGNSQANHTSNKSNIQSGLQEVIKKGFLRWKQILICPNLVCRAWYGNWRNCLRGK
jgi:hypothetical protein